MKKSSFFILACLSAIIICACAGKKENKEEVEDRIEADNDNAFSAEALPDIVDYQRQKSSQDGTGDFNPWEMYGFKELVSADDESDEDYEYDDEYDAVETEEQEGQFQEAGENFEAQPVVYYLGYNVNFKLKNNDISDFSKKADDAVAVIDRLDNNAKQIDILFFDKKLYDDFKKQGDKLERLDKISDNMLVSKGDSTDVDVAVNFAGPANGGYLLSIYNK